MTRASFEEALVSVPVFPLPNVVLFPGATLPLHIFEPRYRAMLKDCLAGHGAMVIAQRVEDGAIAGAGLVVQHRPLPDGRSNILVVGEARVQLESVELEAPPRYPYLRAHVKTVRDLDVEVPENAKTALVAAATMFASEVKKHDASFTFHVPATATAGELADVCAYQLVIDASARQAMLEDLDPRSRVERVTTQIAMQHGAIMRDVPTVLN